MTRAQLPAPAVASRLLTAEAYQRLADVPPEVEWFANLANRCTRRAYQNAIGDFMRFAGIVQPEEFRTVTRCPCHRLARRAGAAQLEWHDCAASPGGAVLAVRVFMREERRDP